MINNYSFEFTATETSAVGTFLYIADHLAHKCRNDLNIYRKRNLDLLLLKWSPQEYLLENIFTKLKSTFLLGHFIVNLLNHNEHKLTFRFSCL